MKTCYISTPVFNSENLRGGQFIRFFLERSDTYPSRCSDTPVCPGAFVGPSRGNLPGFKVPRSQLSDKERLRLASILNAIVAAFVLVWPKCQFGLVANYPNLCAIQPLVTLIKWTVSTYIENGEKFVATRLKLLAAWARYKGGAQLHIPPKTITRFPFCVHGVPDFGQIFTGSISRKAVHTETLIRFSRMSRAFPPGNSVAVEEALAEHKALMTSTVETNPDVLRLFTNVIRKVTRESLAGVETPGVTLSNSSCWERSRRMGGAAEEIHRILDRHYPQFNLRGYVPGDCLETHIRSCRAEGNPETDLFEICYGVEPEGLPHEVPAITEMVYRSLTEEIFPCGPHPRMVHHNVIAIPDRGGFKVRVITAGEAGVQLLAHNVRKLIYRNVLPKTPTKWAIIEDGVKQFLAQGKLPGTEEQRMSYGDWVSLSCDMSSATDRFPHDVVEAMNCSIEQNISSEHRDCPNWIAWKMLSGPQLLRYPQPRQSDGFVEDVPREAELVQTSCGNLMGTAPSWVHLNLMNLTLIRSAWAVWCDSRTRRMIAPHVNMGKFCNFAELDMECVKSRVMQCIKCRGFNPFAFPASWKFNGITCIVGDDLGAICPFAVAVIYEALLELANGKTSFGKHYVQPWQDGSYMLLAEQAAIVDGDRLIPLRYESVRGISAATHQFDSRVDKPAWFQIGTALASAVEAARPSAQRALCSLGHIALANWRSTLLKLGLPVYLPASVGGMGWPHPRGLEYALQRCSRRTLLAYRVLRGFRQDPVRFAHEILKVRAAFICSANNDAYVNLLRTIESYFVGFTVSRDINGALAPITREATIGLKPAFGKSQWSVIADESRCIPLIDVIDKAILNGLATGYLCAVKPPQFDKPHLEARRAARRYRNSCQKLLNLRPGHEWPVLSSSEYLKHIREDEDLLKSLVIYLDHQFDETFPHLSALLLGGAT